MQGFLGCHHVRTLPFIAVVEIVVACDLPSGARPKRCRSRLGGQRPRWAGRLTALRRLIWRTPHAIEQQATRLLQLGPKLVDDHELAAFLRDHLEETRGTPSRAPSGLRRATRSLKLTDLAPASMASTSTPVRVLVSTTKGSAFE
jgi:hypothetical protein